MNGALEKTVENNSSVNIVESSAPKIPGHDTCPFCFKDNDDNKIPIVLPHYLYAAKGLSDSQIIRGQNNIADALKEVKGHSSCYEDKGLFYRINKTKLNCGDCFYSHENKCIKLRNVSATSADPICNHYNPDINPKSPHYKKKMAEWDDISPAIKERKEASYNVLIDELMSLDLIKYERYHPEGHKIVVMQKKQ